MLLLERESNCVAAVSGGPRGYRARVRASDGNEHSLALPFGKTTIGSSPRCNIRLEQPGVQPLHCLILHAGSRLSVRRWAADTRLNGEPFDEATLAAGDCLTVAGVELWIEAVEPTEEQVATAPLIDVSIAAPQPCDESAAAPPPPPPDDAAPQPYDTSGPTMQPCHEGDAAPQSDDEGGAARAFSAALHHSAVWLNDDQRTPWIDEPDGGDASRATDEAELESYRWAPGVEKTVVPFEAAKIVFQELQTATSISRGRSRKLLAALRQNRDEYRRVAERVEDLECLMQAALFEHENLRLFPDESEPNGVESTILARFLETSTESHRAGDAEIEHLQSELTQLAEATHRLAGEREALAHEIAALRERLDSVQQQLAKCEQEATEWQRERGEWSAQRGDWDRQQAEWSAQRDVWNHQRAALEQRFADSEARLAEHVRRVELLEVELATLRQSPPAPQSAFDWSGPHVTQSGGRGESDSPIERPANELSWNSAGRSDEPASEPPEQPNLATDEPLSAPACAEESELAPFAEFSIWSQGAVTPSPPEEPAERLAPEPSSEEPHRQSENSAREASAETASQGVQAKSFIERYAHMFEDDRTAAETPPPAAAPRPTSETELQRKPRNMGIVQRGPAPADEDEESIEQYMAKLLQRVRGDSRHVPASQAAPTATAGAWSTATAMAADQPHTPIVANPSPLWSSGGGPPADDEEHVTTSLGTVRRKVPLAEQSADLEAFRALANESARRAISTHASRKHRRNAVTKVIVSTLAGVTSLWMMLEAPHWRDLQFQTALISLLTAAYWAGQTYRTLIETLRAAAYDGPDDGLNDLVEALSPELPIDMER